MVHIPWGILYSVISWYFTIKFENNSSQIRDVFEYRTLCAWTNGSWLWLGRRMRLKFFIKSPTRVRDPVKKAAEPEAKVET